MSQMQLIAALAGFAFAMSITPGPNNLLIMASGTNFGIKRSLPHLFGISAGFAGMLILVGLGLDHAVAHAPWTLDVLMALSLTYIGWLAWRLARTDRKGKVQSVARPMSFAEAAAFQWVNPKAWGMAITALTAYSVGLGGSVMVALIFTAVNLPCVASWLYAGRALQKWLAVPGRLIWFNRFMAFLLVATMGMIFFA